MSKVVNTAKSSERAPDYGRREQLVIHPTIHPTWAEFVRFCRELKHGEIENLRIQDGLPLMAELVRRKVRFTE